MPPITWQNVAAPDFSGVTQALANQGKFLDAGFGGAADAIGKYGDARRENALADILNQTKGMTDPGQIRNALAGMDTSGLGSGQFAQFDKMLGARGEEATRQQAFEQLRSMNPMLLAEMSEKNRQALVMNPLLADSSRAATAGIQSRTAATELENAYNRSIAGSRSEAGNSGFQDTTSRNNQTIRDREDDAAARRDFANIITQTGPNPPADAEALIGLLPPNISPGVRARMIEMARAQFGSYPRAPAVAPTAAAPAAAPAVAPAAQRLEAAAGGRPPDINDDGEPGTQAYNQRNSTLAAIRDRVVGDIRATEIASGSSAFEAAANSTTSQLEHVDRLKKSGLLSDSRANSINNALNSIKETAVLNGRPLNDSEAAVIFERAIRTTDGVLTDATWIGNSFQANSKGVLADIQALKINAPRGALNASTKMEAAVIRLNNLQTTAAQANQTLSAAIRIAALRKGDSNSPQIQAYREAAKLASDNVERGFANFYKANPSYAQSQPVTGDRDPTSDEKAKAAADAAAAALAEAAGRRSVTLINNAQTPGLTPEDDSEYKNPRNAAAAAVRLALEQKHDRIATRLVDGFGGNRPPDSEILKISQFHSIPLEELKRLIGAKIK